LLLDQLQPQHTSQAQESPLALKHILTQLVLQPLPTLPALLAVESVDTLQVVPPIQPEDTPLEDKVLLTQLVPHIPPALIQLEPLAQSMDQESVEQHILPEDTPLEVKVLLTPLEVKAPLTAQEDKVSHTPPEDTPLEVKVLLTQLEAKAQHTQLPTQLEPMLLEEVVYKEPENIDVYNIHLYHFLSNYANDAKRQNSSSYSVYDEKL
jgi:hypothetical protein